MFGFILLVCLVHIVFSFLSFMCAKIEEHVDCSTSDLNSNIECLLSKLLSLYYLFLAVEPQFLEERLY